MIVIPSCSNTGQNVKYPEAGPGEVLLTWGANHEVDLAGYKVYYGTASRSYTESMDVGLTDTPETPWHLVKKLEKGKTYFFAVTAYDSANNESGFSNEVSKQII